MAGTIGRTTGGQRMIKLRDFLSNESIFTEIGNIEPLPFTADTEVLDALLITLYGNKFVFESFNDVNLTLIAQMVVIKNRAKWAGYIEMEQLVGNVNSRREVIETIVDNETRTGERTDTNKVSAYNTNDLIIDGGSDNNSTDVLDGEKTRTLTDETIDVKQSYDMLNLLGKETVASKVITDVAQFLTLPIY